MVVKNEWFLNMDDMKELTLWRYLSHEKWLLLLEDNGLFFSKASKFEDKNEGYYDVEGKYSILQELHPESIDVIDKARCIAQSIRDKAPEHTYISCWQNMSDESLRMWKEYVSDEREGVLVRSDIISLLLNIPKSLSEVITGKNCKYFANDSENLNFNNPFEYKRDLYSFESEYRLVLDSMQMSIMTGFNPDEFGEVLTENENGELLPFHETLPLKNASDDVQIKPEAGYVIKYPLDRIIHEVRVHPLASDIYLSRIRDDLKKAGVNCPVNRSAITHAEFFNNSFSKM
ncbi:hypothetical protein [Serratia marcescens]|uniref:hypothetical protein n=1 Tax=Serratia marcescens TaxID=615 RepID=UPI0011C0624A|nr:hypothetical protein [Serratia marcescens]